MLTRGAISNLINRYRAVLTKCRLINTFGSFAIASMLVLGGAGMAGAATLADLERDSDGAYLVTQKTTLGNSRKKTDLDVDLIKVVGVSKTVGLTIAGSKDSSITGDIHADGKTSINLGEGSTIDGQIIVGYSGELLPAAPSLSLKGPITMSGQRGSDGGAIVIHQSDINVKGEPWTANPIVTIDGLTFTKNSATNSGGAIYNESRNTTISNTTFGALDSMGNADTTMGNTAGSKGGALYSYRTVTLSDSAFYGNASQNGGAMWNQGSETQLGRTVFKGNTASESGGAVYSMGRLDMLGSNTFASNSATGGSGGAIYLVGGLNAVGDDSGGSIFTGNTASGGVTHKSSRGGALFNDSNKALSALEKASFTENSAADGGAVYYVGQGFSLKDTIFTGNTATGNGGALHVEGSFNTGSVTMENATFTGNTAGGQGGALYVSNRSGTAAVNFYGTNEFSGNRAHDAVNDIYSEGAVNILGGTTTMEGIVMNGAALTVDSGSLRVSQNARLAVKSGPALDVLNGGTAALNGSVTVTAESEAAACGMTARSGGTMESEAGSKLAVHVFSETASTGIRLSGDDSAGSAVFRGDVDILASGDNTAYGLHISETASAKFHGATTVAASAEEQANAHAFYGDGSILNTGKLAVSSGQLSGFTGTYTQTAGSTDITQAADFFGGRVSIEGGSLTVDASQFAAGKTFAAALDRADFASGAALNVDFAHLDDTSYTLAEYFKARDALLNGDAGKLVFLNATLERSDSDTVLLGQSGGTVASSGVVFAAKGWQSYDEAVAAGPSQTFAAAAGDRITLADADSREHHNTAESVTFSSSLIAQGLNVGQMKALVVDSGAALQFAATGEKGLFIDSDGSETAADITVNSGGSLALGMAGQEGAQSATLGDVTVDGTCSVDANGAVTVSGGRFELGNGTADARYRINTITVNGLHLVRGNGAETTKVDCGTLTVNGAASIADAAFSASRIETHGVFTATGSDLAASSITSFGLTSLTGCSVLADIVTVSDGTTELDNVKGRIGQFSAEAGEAVLHGVKEGLNRLDVSGEADVSVSGSALNALSVSGGEVTVSASEVNGDSSVGGGRLSAENGSALSGLSVDAGEVSLEASSVSGPTSVNSGKLSANGSALNALSVSGGEATVSASEVYGDSSVRGGRLSAENGSALGGLSVDAGEVSLEASSVSGPTSVNSGKLSASGSALNALSVSGGEVTVSASEVSGDSSVRGGRLSAENGSALSGLCVDAGEVSLEASSVSGPTSVNSGKLSANGSALNALSVSGGEVTLADSSIAGAVSVTGGSLAVSGNNLKFKNDMTAGTVASAASSVRILADTDLTITGDVANLCAPEAAPRPRMTLAAGNALHISGEVKNDGVLTIEATDVELSAADSALCGSGTTAITADTIAIQASSAPAVSVDGEVTLHARKGGTIAGGIKLGDAGSVALNGAFSVSGDLAGAGSIVNNGTFTVGNGTVSGFTGLFSQTAGATTLTASNGFFGGRVELSGGELEAHTVKPVESLTLHGDSRLIVGHVLDLSTGSLVVRGGSVDAVGASIVEGEGSLVLNGEGSVTADAEDVLRFTYKQKNGMTALAGTVAAAGNMGATIDGIQGSMKLNFDTVFSYTLDQFEAAEKALFGDRATEKATLTFLNGKVDTSTEDAEIKKDIVIGAEFEGGKATLGPGTKPQQVEEGNAATSPGGHNTAFAGNVVELHDKDAHGLLEVREIYAEGVVFHAQAIKTGNDAFYDEPVKFIVDGDGTTESDILLAGTGAGLVLDKDDKAVKLEVEISEGSSLTIGQGVGVEDDIKADIEKADINGRHKVDGNGADKAKVTYQEMHIGRDADTDSRGGDVRILHASVHIGKLDIHKGRLFIDPAYAKIDSLGTLNGDLVVGSGSVAALGDVANLEKHVKLAGLATHAAGDGFTVDKGRAVLALGQTVSVGGTGQLVVNGGLTSDKLGPTGTGTGSGNAEFASGSLLVVHSKLAEKGAVLTGSGTLAVGPGAKLYLVDARVGPTYTMTEGFTGEAGWSLVTNVLTEAQLIKEGDKVVLKVAAVDLSETMPGVIPVNALTRLAADGPDSGTSEVGKKFLSLAIDPMVIAEGAQVDTINEVTRAAVTAGVQNTALRLADAASNTVLDHLSLAGHTASVHADGADFWAAPMYGNLYTSGMATGGSSVRGQFGGLALGADLEAGQFLGGTFRVGASINGGGGQSETKGTATSTQNDYDFGGLNFYAGWNNGALNVIGSVGYGFGNHEVEMGIPVADVNKAKADVDTTTLTADLRAEYQLNTAWVDVLPHIGVRYTALRTDDHELKADGVVLNSVERATQNIVQFPIGVTLSKDFAFADWSVKPTIDVSVIPAAGDTKAETKVKFSGLNAWDSAHGRIMDSSSWAGTIGVQTEKGNLSLGLNYGVQASRHETDQNIQLKLGWKF